MEQQLREELEFIITEDIIFSVPIAAAVVLGPWLIRQRKIKKAAKEKCKKFEGLARKRCIINVEIESLKKEKSKMMAGMSQCNKHPEPKKSRCIKSIQGLIKDYDTKITKQRAKIG